MKTSWFVYFIIIGMFITVLFAFNYKGKNDVIPLNEIFSEEEVYPVDVEYEFVNQDNSQFYNNNKSSKEPKHIKTYSKVAKIEDKNSPIMNKQRVASKTLVDRSSKKEVSYYKIQVASFKNRKSALQKSKEMKNKGYHSYIMEKNLGNKGIWYRVYINNIQTYEDARTILNDLGESYKGSLIISTK